jgi:hypothetical protein
VSSRDDKFTACAVDRIWIAPPSALIAFLVFVLLGVPTQSQAATAHSVGFSVGGRAHAIRASGVVDHRGVPSGKRAWLAVLQQRVDRKEHPRWLSRASTPVRNRRGSYRYDLRWADPPTGRPLALRVLVVAHGDVVGRSRVRSVTAGDPGTVFYSGEGDAGASDVSSGVVRLVQSLGFLGLGHAYDGEWTGSNECETAEAVPTQLPSGGEPITELAGYSLGRLGPIYFLRSSTWVPQISYILLLDPGNGNEMAASCDAHGDIGPAGALAAWLGLSSSNRLVVMAGPATLADNFAGLDKYYLHGLSSSSQTQVLICYTASPGHDSFLDGGKGGFGWMVGAPPPTSCPPHTSERKNWRTSPSKAPHPQPTTPTSAPAPTPPPASLPPGEYYVQNAEGGIFWRSGPDWNTPVETPGVGFYPGTVIRPTCYQAGAANVPGSADGVWEQASRVGGPGSGSGWINEHFIADGAAHGQPSPGPPQCSSAPSNPTRIDLYDNYGGGAVGRAMCRGNPGRPESMPGGVATETLTVPPDVASVDTALVQIDPDQTVTADATLSVDGVARASAAAPAAGDTTFTFPAVPVQAGDSLSLSITFTATYGKIITVYTVGSPGGTFTASNSCPDGAASLTTSEGLRAVISGWAP